MVIRVLTKRCKYLFDLLWADMESWEILGLAARHYNILKCLRKKKCDYSELGKATNAPRSTLGNYIEEMANVGLLEVKEEGNKKVITILEKGKITLDYINKFAKLFFEPDFDEEIHGVINEIQSYYERGYQIKTIEEIFSKKLIPLCNKKPEAIFNPILQDFFENYLNKQEFNTNINGIVLRYVPYIIQNLKLNSWFYTKIFPILIAQVKDKEIEDLTRNARVGFLWEIFRFDGNRKEEILNIFIGILENECKNQEGEICKFIGGSCPVDAREEVIKRLLEISAKEELMRKFLSSI
jgi:predicted transcriptional regulator